MVTIVTSHWNEDLTWLKESEFPVVLIDKEGADPTCFEPAYVIPNKGHEASVYLKFIIENYHDLPDHVAFIHGHEYAWHQPQNILELVRNANIEKYGFISLNGTYVDWFVSGPTYPFPNVSELCFENILVLEDVPVSAQFIVSKERILLNTLEMYTNLYNMLMINDITPYLHINAKILNLYGPVGPIGHEHVFESYWHILFGESNLYTLQPDFFKIPLIIVQNYKIILLETGELYAPIFYSTV